MVKTTYPEVKTGQLFKFIQDIANLSYIKLDNNSLLYLYPNSPLYKFTINPDYFINTNVVIYNDFNIIDTVVKYTKNLDCIAEHYVNKL